MYRTFKKLLLAFWQNFSTVLSYVELRTEAFNCNSKQIAKLTDHSNLSFMEIKFLRDSFTAFIRGSAFSENMK
jgi:hypothetical protein